MNTTPWIRLFPEPFYALDGVTPLAAGTITTKLANTATTVATGSDAAGTPNANPLTLSSGGRAVMYFSPLNAGTAGVAYDVEVRNAAGSLLYTYEDITVPVPTAGGNATSFVSGAGPVTTLTIAGGSITPTKNRHAVSPEGGSADNLDTIDTSAFPDGGYLTIYNTNGSAAITVRNNQGNIFTSDGQSVVLSTTAQRLTVQRDGSNWFVIAATSAAITTQDNAICDFRITLTSGVPVTTSDVTAAGTIYVTPYKGNRVALYDGTSAWNLRTANELSISNTLTADQIADVFLYDNGGVVTAVFGTVWTNSTTRALGLTTQNGILVLGSDTRYRYIGTVGATGTNNQTEDSLTSRLVRNYYNRVRRPMRRLESTATWSYNTATFRQANAAAANQLKVICGVAEDSIDVSVNGFVTFSAVQQQGAVSIGVNSTSAPATGVIGQTTQMLDATADPRWTAWATLTTQESVGRSVYVWLEKGGGTGTGTWSGVTSGLVQTGIAGTVWG